MTRYTIGIDYGTDSARAVLVDACNGRIVAGATCNYARWAEGRWCEPLSQQFRQHPLDYIECLESVLREVVAACPDPAAIRAISVDTTGSTVCFTDAEGMPLSLRPEFADDPDAMFVLWKDHTGTVEAEEFTAAGARYTPNYTCQSGNHYSAECTWAKVLHILRTNASPRHVPARMIQVPDIPRTLNGKKVESAVTNIVNGRKVTNRDALENPESLDFYYEILPDLQAK